MEGNLLSKQQWGLGASSAKERGAVAGMVGGPTVFNSLRGAHMGMESLCVLRARLELLGSGGRFSFRERGWPAHSLYPSIKPAVTTDI